MGKKAMTSGAIVAQVAEKTELKAKQVRAVFAELREVAYAEVAKTEKFTIPQLVMLKLKHKPARKAGTKMMFGKEVRVAAKPASKVVKAFAAKSLKDSILGASHLCPQPSAPWGQRDSAARGHATLHALLRSKERQGGL